MRRVPQPEAPHWIAALIEKERALPTKKRRKKLPWAKVYRRWYTTGSHFKLDGVTLALGPVVFTLIHDLLCPIDADGAAWLWDLNDHSPITIADLARESRFNTRQVSRAVDRLVNCNTFMVTDGVIGVVNFLQWQKTPDAIAKARQRAVMDAAKASVIHDVVADVRDGVLYAQALRTDN